MADLDKLEKDINAVGARVTEIDKETAKVTVKVERTERDVSEIWCAIDGIRTDLKCIKDEMAKVIGKVSWVAGAISASAVIVATLLQEFLKR